MPFHHEKLTVYKRALEFATWSQELIESVTKKTSTRDHLERAGDSIALNIAEGNGKFSRKDGPDFFKSRTAPRWSRQHASTCLLHVAAVPATPLERERQSWKRS